FEFIIEVKWKYEINGVRLISICDNKGKVLTQSYKVETYDINNSTQYASFKILKTPDVIAWNIVLYQDSGTDLDAILNVKLIGPIGNLNSVTMCGCPKCSDINIVTGKITIPAIHHSGSKSVTKTAAKPVTKSITKKITKPITNKVTKKVTIPITKKVTKPITKKVTKPITKKVTRPITKKVTTKASQRPSSTSKSLASRLLASTRSKSVNGSG